MGVIGDLVRAVTMERGQSGCSGCKITGERGIGNRKYGLFGQNSGVGEVRFFFPYSRSWGKRPVCVLPRGNSMCPAVWRWVMTREVAQKPHI